MQIALSDWINIAQTVVLLLTGAVVVWYTIETARIRKETSVQNTLLAEQLRLMQSARQEAVEKEKSFIKPYFRFGGGTSSGNSASWDFTNMGGPAKKISVRSLGSFNVEIMPTRYLDTKEKGHINFTASNLVPHGKYPFEISCQDKVGDRYVFKFVLSHQDGISEEDV